MPALRIFYCLTFGLLATMFSTLEASPRAAKGSGVSADPNATLYERPPQRAGSATFAVLPTPVPDAQGYLQINFDYLASFPFPIPAVGTASDPTGIPASIQALDGQRVRIDGYMLPVQLEHEKVKECLLLRSQMLCCYGLPPAATEWIIVKVSGPALPDKMDTPLTFYGTLHVGPTYENNTFEGIYQLTCEKAQQPK